MRAMIACACACFAAWLLSQDPIAARFAAAGDADAVTKVTVKNVEYVWQGLTREGAGVTATVLATSKDGMQVAPRGNMTLIDPEGNKYTSGPATGNKLPLREGVPVKITWLFGKKGFGGGIDPAKTPSAKIKTFAAAIIHQSVGSKTNTIDFRNVPAVVEKEKAK